MQQVTAALLLLFCAISIYSKDDENIAQKAEMQKKIVEYREKSSKVIHKITAAREEAENESRTHERYKENFSKELKHLEKENIIAALHQTNWKVSGRGGAAELLGTRPTTLASRIKTLGIHKQP